MYRLNERKKREKQITRRKDIHVEYMKTASHFRHRSSRTETGYYVSARGIRYVEPRAFSRSMDPEMPRLLWDGESEIGTIEVIVLE